MELVMILMMKNQLQKSLEMYIDGLQEIKKAFIMVFCTWVSLVVLMTNEGELKCFEEVMEDRHKAQWIESMREEMKSLHENDTCELVKLVKGMRALTKK